MALLASKDQKPAEGFNYLKNTSKTSTLYFSGRIPLCSFLVLLLSLRWHRLSISIHSIYLNKFYDFLVGKMGGRISQKAKRNRAVLQPLEEYES
jgi:hypothetical protein